MALCFGCFSAWCVVLCLVYFSLIQLFFSLVCSPMFGLFFLNPAALAVFSAWCVVLCFGLFFLNLAVLAVFQLSVWSYVWSVFP